MRDVDVAIVGGGPAGLAAAAVAARAGRRTLLLDEQPSLGGQLRYRRTTVRDGHGLPAAAGDLRQALIEVAEATGASLQSGATVWGAFAGNVLGVIADGGSFQVRAQSIIFATGSHDRPLAFAGASLPGVFTARAMQILLNVHRVVPGERFVVVGDGFEAEEVASDLLQAGAGVERASVVADLAAGGARGVEWVTIDGRRVAADGVVLAVGRLPDLQLPLMAECACGRDAAVGGYRPVRDSQLRSSIDGMYIVGDAAGVDEVAVAILEGTLAGAAAAGNASEIGAAQQALRAFRADRLEPIASLGHPHLSWQRMVSA